MRILRLNSFAIALILTAIAGAVPRLWLGSSQFVEYDGYWHVFIAQQDDWGNFWRDIQTNAHPPLYFLLLKLMLAFGRSLLIYRAISLATGIASIYLVGKIADRLNVSRVWSWLAALAFAGAMPAIIIACEVRSYMLSTFFTLWSYWFFLHLLGDGDHKASVGSRVGFASMAVLACLSHYSAFFYVGACTATLIARNAAALIRSRRGAGRAWRDAVTLLPVLAAVVTLYEMHAGKLAVIQQHLLPYYYNAEPRETVAQFLVRNSANMFKLFSPVGRIPETIAAASFAATLFIAVVCIVVLFRLRAGGRDERAAWTVFLSLLMLGAVMISGVAGKYPFGGELRQQFLLFPYAVICGSIVLDRLALSVPRGAAIVLAAAALGGILFSSALRFYEYPKVKSPVGAERMAVFHRLLPSPSSLYLDQFSLILFFQFHDTWNWTFLRHDADVPGIDVYRVTQGNRTMVVYRDTTRWNLDPQDGPVYDSFARLLREPESRELAVFCIFGTRKSQVEHTVRTLANNRNLCVEKAILNRLTWFAQFRRSPCATTAPGSGGTAITYSSENDELEYQGTWTYGQYPSAPGSVVFSNQAGASVRLTFTGTEVTYVYTKTYNAGFGLVKIDGIARDTLDLYTPGIAWQNKNTWGNLPPGPHTFELIVTGKKSPESSDTYVTLESVVVH